MLNIVFIIKYYYPLKRPSGILRFVMNLSEKLGQKTNLTVVTCKFDKKHKSSENYKNYKIIRINPPFYILSAIKTAKLKPDLVIFGTGISKLWILFMVSIIFKYFNIIFSRIYNLKRPKYFLYQFVDLDYKSKFLVKYVCGIFEKIICTNNTLYSFYLKYNNKKEKVFYLPPGINLPKFYNIKCKMDKKIRIGFFGHLNYRKGSDLLVRAFLKLDNKNTELFLAGLGNFKNKYKQLALRHKNIIVKEYIDNIEESIALCSLLVFPYRSSDKILGLSLSAIEGLALEKPLIVSNNNCLRDLVEHGKNGYILENENELVSYLREMTEDKEKIIKFGIESKRKSSKFDINLTCDKLINLF